MAGMTNRRRWLVAFAALMLTVLAAGTVFAYTGLGLLETLSLVGTLLALLALVVSGGLAIRGALVRR